MSETDRVFTDTTAQHFEEKVIASAEKRHGRKPVWVRSQRIGPTKKPYVHREMGIVDDEGKVTHVARVNRAGAVTWHTPWTNETYEVETI